MSLSSRFGFGRARVPLAGDPVQPDDSAIFLTNDAAASPEIASGLKSPQVRTIYRGKRAAPPPAADTPFPSRFDGKAGSRSPLDRFGLSGKDRRLADELFGEPEAPERTSRPKTLPKPAVRVVKRKKMDRGDLTIGALGVTLGLICALFPWYIFFNQEKFGVREFVFEGSGSVTPPSSIAYQPPLVGRHFQTGEVPRMDLDFFPTATLPGENEPVRPVPASEQPFPSDLVNFRLVHVANGRAMIQDEDGLWIVQPGSRLPDASQVASIEQRQGSWVLVTTHDKVVSLEP